MFRNRIPVARASISDELPLPGDRQHAQETDVITGWTLNKDCKTKHEVLEVVSGYFGVFSQVGCAGTIIPVVVKTPALCSTPGVSMAFFTLESKKRLAGWEKPDAQKCWQQGVQCQQAARGGCAAHLGAGEHLPVGDSHTNSHPCSPQPIQGSQGSSPHTAPLSKEPQCLGPLPEEEHAWFHYFFNNNESNRCFHAMDVLQNPLSEWFG